MTYHAQGQTGKSEKLLNELSIEFGESIAYFIAQIMAFSGDSDGAFGWLERAKQAVDYELSNVINEPLFANLYDDPRWLEFLKGLGKSADQLEAIVFNVMPLK